MRKTINLSNAILSTSVQDMSNVFNKCATLENVDLSNVNMSNIRKVESMFNGCNLKTLNLSGANLLGVTNLMRVINTFLKKAEG